MSQRPDHLERYPLPEYVASWKVFRTLSNEDNRIADAVIKAFESTILFDTYPKRIVDVGPGDGRVLMRILIGVKERAEHVSVVEPNKHFMSETLCALDSPFFADFIEQHPTDLAEVDPETLETADVVLCTHTVYFLKDAEIETLIRIAKRGIPVVFVLDSPASVFTQIWKDTAPRFYERVQVARRMIENSGLTVSHRSITQQITAELADLSNLRPEIAELAKNLLSYTEYISTDTEYVDQTIKDMSERDGLPCISDLFVLRGNQRSLTVVENT